MADTKITALTAIGANPIIPSTFPIPMVDLTDTSMAASGTTKKVTVNQILGAGGTATLASATITGDLTVDTNVLKVDTSLNRVGINNASPTTNLHVGSGVGLNNLGVGLSRGATTNFYEAFDGTKSFLAGTDSSQTGVKVGALSNHSMFLVCNNITQLQIDPLGVFSFTDGAGGTRMTLNSTGLLVGASASGNGEKFNANGTIVSSNQSIGGFAYNQGGFDYSTSTKNLRIYAGTSNATGSSMSFVVGTSTSFLTAMTLDASGNLLVGQTSVGEAGIVSIKGSNGIGIENNASGSSSINANFTFGSGTGYFGYFKYNGTLVGTIASTGAGNCTFNQVSDYRLKEDVQPIVGALNRINSLKPSTYKWKINGSAGEGFLAHELAAGVPLAVTGEKDAVNEDGSIQPQQVDLSKVVPVLVAAIQELAAEVNALKNA